jgi:hypothetical protein
MELSRARLGALAGIPSLESLYAGTESPPQATGPAAVPGKSIAWISCGQVAQGCAVPTAAAADAAKVLGWNFTMLDARLNAAGGLGSSIRHAIALKPDAIVTDGLDCEAARQPLEDAKSAGIPVLVGPTGLQRRRPRTGGGPRHREQPCPRPTRGHGAAELSTTTANPARPISHHERQPIRRSNR